jgi:aarF domain-containing kinase
LLTRLLKFTSRLQYPVFEAALTGRATLEGSSEDPVGTDEPWANASSLLDSMPQSEEELDAIRHAVVEREGLLVSIFDMLRRVPRRVLMVFKLNDLTRSLDHALHTTHSSVRFSAFSSFRWGGAENSGYR